MTASFSGVKTNFKTLLEQGVNGAEPGGKVLHEFAVVPKASEEPTELLDGRGDGHKGESGDLVGVRNKAGRAKGVSQEIDIGAFEGVRRGSGCCRHG